MNYFLSILLTAISVFVATNFDDLLILMLLLSPKSSKVPIWKIVVGQYLGFTLIILGSLVGFLGGLMIPKTWIGLLGFIPLIIGVKSLLNREDESNDIQLTSVPSSRESKSKFWKWIPHRWLTSVIISVASITVANGGDNISIYLSLFSQSDLTQLTLILAIFYLLVGLWILLAYWLVRHPLIAKILLRHRQTLTPWIFILLGIFILVESQSFRLLFPD